VNRRTGGSKSSSAEAGHSGAAAAWRCVATFTALALLLYGCGKPTSDAGQSEPVTPPVIAPAQPPPRLTVRTSWTFTAGNDECVAVAAGGGTSLRVSIRRAASINLVLSAPTQTGQRFAEHGPVPVRFAGSAGRWQVSAQQLANHQLNVTLGTGDIALSRVLVLLSGGVLDVLNPEQVTLSLTIAPSDAAGQYWFDCARSKLL